MGSVAASNDAYNEIMSRMPGLMYERHKLQMAYIQPTAVMLPARLNVPYDGEDATDAKATLMGLPVVWVDEERWGLVVEIPIKKEDDAGRSQRADH
jgi:hypothetical protein